jgi:hypothetical protein
MTDRADESRIIDTNVLVTANHQHDGAPADCIVECAEKLQAIKQRGHIVLDDAWRILRQYQSNVREPGVGYEFLKWLYDVRSTEARCTQVSVTEKHDDQTDFDELPAPLRSAAGDRIDPNDRVFLAVAAAHPLRPPIVQATDSKWIGWEVALRTYGITIDWVCRAYAEATYKKKMPKRDVARRSPSSGKRTRPRKRSRR